MLNNNFIKSIINTYGIKKVSIIEGITTLDVIIHSMKDSLPLEKWNLIENVLNDATNKTINLITYNQAIKHLGESYISKGQVIQ